MRRLYWVALLLMLASCKSDYAEPLPVGEELAMGQCHHYNPTKNPYFGDLHVHTSFSIDAVQFDTQNDPNQAYRFAKGQPIEMWVEGEKALKHIDRPLDFAGVSDHSEFLAEANICFTLDSIHYFAPYCIIMRGSKEGKSFIDTVAFLLAAGSTSIPDGKFHPGVCTGKLRGKLCEQRSKDTWVRIQNAAERHYDRSSNCSFTTFIGYEWTGTPGFQNKHRNVFFKTANVPHKPFSYYDAPTDRQLWNLLDQECTNAGTGCDVLTIPHNSNLGGGSMFNPLTEDESPYSPEQALQRQRLEPLVEIYQHKGTSECVDSNVPYGSQDELCNFEQVVSDICTGSENDSPSCTPLCSDVGFAASLGGGCIAPSDFVRATLRRGLEVQSEIGENPFQFGFIGSTDSHNATPGATEESTWTGHVASSDDTLPERLSVAGIADNHVVKLASELSPAIEDIAGFAQLSAYSPGGLAVVWAEQNTRSALFNAMQKREAYATSGTRIKLRMFAGDTLPNNLCSTNRFAELGYQYGVPMGAEIQSNHEQMKIAVSAAMDIGSASLPGTGLQRIQIIKGWVRDGESHEKVIHVSGDNAPTYGNVVDTCTNESGFAQLCAVWNDPDFNPDEDAFYYARVVEQPSCRWSHRQCKTAMADKNLTCADIAEGDPLWKCCDGSLPATIQERAWSSPIWYTSH